MLTNLIEGRSTNKGRELFLAAVMAKVFETTISFMDIEM